MNLFVSLARAGRAILGAAVAALSAATTPTIPESLTYSGMSDASAAVALDQDLFVVASDEDNVLRLYSRTAPGQPRGTLNLSGFLRLTRGSPETDLEGAALLGDRIFWITSHGQNAGGKTAPNRHRFFATALCRQASVVTLTPVGLPCTSLLEELVTEPRLAHLDLRAAAKRPPKDPSALNIEGLGATPDGGLLIGFRNPLPRGQALLVPLLNPEDVVHGARPQLGAPLFLDLGGLGVRDLLHRGGRLFLIAGPPGSGHPFRLYEWTFGTAPPRVIGRLDLPDATPEVIVAFPGDPPGDMLVLSDDGARAVAGTVGKKLKKAELRHFRAWRLNL